VHGDNGKTLRDKTVASSHAGKEHSTGHHGMGRRDAFTSAYICIVRAVRWRTAGDHGFVGLMVRDAIPSSVGSGKMGGVRFDWNGLGLKHCVRIGAGVCGFRFGNFNRPDR